MPVIQSPGGLTRKAIEAWKISSCSVCSAQFTQSPESPRLGTITEKNLQMTGFWIWFTMMPRDHGWNTQRHRLKTEKLDGTQIPCPSKYFVGDVKMETLLVGCLESSFIALEAPGSHTPCISTCPAPLRDFCSWLPARDPTSSRICTTPVWGVWFCCRGTACRWGYTAQVKALIPWVQSIHVELPHLWAAGSPHRDRKDECGCLGQCCPAQTLLDLADNWLRGSQISHHYEVAKGLQIRHAYSSL